jgi:hypothetical protein
VVAVAVAAPLPVDEEGEFRCMHCNKAYFYEEDVAEHIKKRYVAIRIFLCFWSRDEFCCGRRHPNVTLGVVGARPL